MYRRLKSFLHLKRDAPENSFHSCTGPEIILPAVQPVEAPHAGPCLNRYFAITGGGPCYINRFIPAGNGYSAGMHGVKFARPVPVPARGTRRACALQCMNF